MSKKTLGKIDDRAFGVLFQKYSQALFNYVNSMANDSFLAQDIVQDTYVKLWNSKEHLNFDESIVGYMYKMAYSIFCDRQKKTKRESKMLDSLMYQAVMHYNEERIEDRLEKIERIKKIIDTLPPKTLVIFKMSKYQGYKYREIAEELNISIKTVENQMGRAFSLIKKRLKEKKMYLLFLNLFGRHKNHLNTPNSN